MLHSHIIVEQIIAGKDIIELEVFEGKIVLQLIDDCVKYKFIPNDDFNKLVVSSILEKKDSLVINVTDKLKFQLLNAYKDIL